jgi:hypothetical protein
VLAVGVGLGLGLGLGMWCWCWSWELEDELSVVLMEVLLLPFFLLQREVCMMCMAASNPSKEPSNPKLGDMYALFLLTQCSLSIDNSAGCTEHSFRGSRGCLH